MGQIDVPGLAGPNRNYPNQQVIPGGCMKCSMKPRWIGIRSVLAFALLTSLAFAQSRTVAKPQNLGPEDGSKLLTVSVWLNEHNKAGLDEMVRQMYLPGSPTYHHFLTRDQYREQFAPTAAEAAQVRDYLVAHNFTVSSVDKFNHYLVAQGRVSDAQDAFNVQLSRVNFNGEIHRVSSGSASIAGEVGKLVHTVEGLSDFAPKPALKRAV